MKYYEVVTLNNIDINRRVVFTASGKTLFEDYSISETNQIFQLSPKIYYSKDDPWYGIIFVLDDGTETSLGARIGSRGFYDLIYIDPPSPYDIEEMLNNLDKLETKLIRNE